MKMARIHWFIWCLLTLMATRISAIPPETLISVRGAASRADLTKILFQAIKNNEFEALNNYLPDDNHLEILKIHSNEIDKVFYDGLTSGSIKIQTEENFAKIIKAGIDKSLNWSSLQLVDTKAKSNKSLKNIQTTLLVVEDNKEVPFSFSYDCIKISNRWFIIQGMRKEVDNVQLGLID